MSVAVITGSGGLIGSEAARFVHDKGMDVAGIDNDLRSYFFGREASTAWNVEQLQKTLKNYKHACVDIRDEESISKLFRDLASNIELVVHTAAQPSHDWAALEPLTDFTINANGTLILLEAVRRFSPEAVFVFTSTNKVYGDAPNLLPLVELDTRWELERSHPYSEHGIDETMSIDHSKHSLFGASKAAADLLTQEYGRYFGMKTGTFRGGCLTGPAHSGAEMHGFLAYLAKCAVSGRPYTVYGYKGKQVRDNIHSFDLVNAFWHFFQKPAPGEVYNMGGSRYSNCSILEAIGMIETMCGKRLDYQVSETARSGDHVWWISDVSRFQKHYPEWQYRYDLPSIIREIVDATEQRSRTIGTAV
ncbi:MAG: NAD-dependent epimerase/dehydratase family protein [Acidobacteria bacterium]|nr:NAD-dependent epimerase/dehydratase family protein [Acidobacteriota bacterium]